MASARWTGAAALHFGISTTLRAACRCIEASSSRQHRFAHTAATDHKEATLSELLASTSRLSSPRRRKVPPVQDLRFPSPPYGPYEIFHLPRTATNDEIKARYFDLARLMHPDTAPAAPNLGVKVAAEKATSTRSGPKAHAQRAREWEEMQRAYAILRKSSSRRAYDQYGAGWSGGGQKPTWPSRGSQYAWGKPTDGRAPARTNWHFGGRGHDGFGWQAYAASNSSSFYGYRPPDDGDEAAPSPPGVQPRYTSNVRFFGALIVLTWAIGVAQYGRISAQSARVVERADREHFSAVKSLEAARIEARSTEGRKRMENLRKRAREMEIMRDDTDNFVSRGTVPLLEAPR